MKLDAGRAEQFLKKPDPSIAIALLHGPDAGLIVERAERLGRHVVPDLRDPFRVTELTGDQLRQTPERLVEEAQALCLMGGRRLVRVRLASEVVRPAVELLLSLERAEAFVVIEADELQASSKLRQLAERSPKIAVIACYHDSERDLAATLRDSLSGLGVELEPEASTYLQANLGGDRGVTQRELEKLALFAMGRDRPIGLAEIAALIGDASALALDDVVSAAFRGERQRLDQLLDRLFKEGMAPLRVLRAAAATGLALLRMRLRLDAGEGFETVLAGVRPQLATVRDRYRMTLSSLTSERLHYFLDLLQEAELHSKTAASPDALLCRRALAEICLNQEPFGRRPEGGFRTGPRSGRPHRA